MSLTLRQDSTTVATTKGAPLTHAEMDANWLFGLNSTNHNVIQSGNGATSRTAQAKMRDVYHIKDFGAVCDGTTDDTSAITNALTAVGNGTLYVSGTPLISSKITVSNRCRIVFEGAPGSSTQAPASYLIKKSSMTTTALEVGAVGTEILGGGVIGQASNTGDGIHVLARSVHLNGVYVYNMGNDGFVVGAAAAATDCNYWRATGCHAYQNGRDGFHIESTTPNANAGMAIACVSDENTRDGYRVAKANTCVFQNCNGSGNDGWGFYNDAAEYTVLMGGDFESNTADGTNQIYNSANAEFFTVIGLRPEFKISDVSYTLASQPYNVLTKRLDKFVEMSMAWQPVIAGTTTAAKTVSTITRSGTTVTFNITGHGYAVGEGFAIEDTGTLFDGGYIVATVPGVDSITATVSADRAGKLPASAGAANAYLGYDATPTGYWHRIGDTVFFQGHISADNVALDATVTGNTIVRGFPYPSENVSTQFAPIAVLDQSITYPAGASAIGAYMSPNAYFINIVGVGTGITVAAVPTGASGMPITGVLTISGHYKAAAYTV